MASPLAVAAALLLALLARPAAAGDAGILYEVWHTEAATAMASVAQKGFPQLTVELVIQSQDTAKPLQLDDVYGPAGLNADICAWQRGAEARRLRTAVSSRGRRASLSGRTLDGEYQVVW